MSTETPRIDRIAFMARFTRDALGTFEAVHADSARQLERELTAAQSTIAEQAKEIERLRDGLSGLLGLFHLLYERDDAPPWLREIALTNHRAQLARRLLMEPSNADRL